MARPMYIRSAPPNRKPKTKPRPDLFAKYMQRPPTIMPNYGKNPDKLGVPKTSLSRVLMYDNITQQQMLDVKIANIRIEKQRAEQLFNAHKRTFSIQMKKLTHCIHQREERQRRREAKAKQVTQFPSLLSQRTCTLQIDPVLRRVSTLSLSDLRLPDIDPHNKHIFLKLQTKSGRRRLFHSYDESGMFADAVPMCKFYPAITEDPRFRKLETSLIYPEDEQTAGYAILSPSYANRIPKIPEFLQESGDVKPEKSV